MKYFSQNIQGKSHNIRYLLYSLPNAEISTKCKTFLTKFKTFYQATKGIAYTSEFLMPMDEAYPLVTFREGEMVRLKLPLVGLPVPELVAIKGPSI